MCSCEPNPTTCPLALMPVAYLVVGERTSQVIVPSLQKKATVAAPVLTANSLPSREPSNLSAGIDAGRHASRIVPVHSGGPRSVIVPSL